MCFKLKEDVTCVDDKEEYGRAAGELGDLSIFEILCIAEVSAINQGEKQDNLRLPSAHDWKAAGMIRLPTASASKLDAVWATVRLKCCLIRLSPPKKKHIPITRSRLDRMLPIKDSCTMSTSPLTRAITDTINSTAFLFRSQRSDLYNFTVIHTRNSH